MVSVPASVTGAGIGDRAEAVVWVIVGRGQRQLGRGGAAIDGDGAGIADRSVASCSLAPAVTVDGGRHW